jgi:hypothetical protein
MTKRLASRWTLIAVVAVMGPVASLGVASPATAEPLGILKIFKNCPLKEMKELGANPEESLCNFNETTGGEFNIAGTKVPINSGVNAGKKITLEGGAIQTGNPDNEDEYFLLPGANGQSFSKTELSVPGGLTDFVNCEEIKGEGLWEKFERGACKVFFESGPLEVTATTESVATTKNPAILNLQALGLEENLPAVTVAVRVHLKNTFLGNSCYVGSEEHPIELHLTTGTTSPDSPNKPIKGKTGTEETVKETFEGKRLAYLRIKNNSLVDNSFSVPKAEGCGEFFSFLIDPVVDSKLKLPSEDGNNTAILEGTLNTTTAENIETHE